MRSISNAIHTFASIPLSDAHQRPRACFHLFPINLSRPSPPKSSRLLMCFPFTSHPHLSRVFHSCSTYFTHAILLLCASVRAHECIKVPQYVLRTLSGNGFCAGSTRDFPSWGNAHITAATPRLPGRTHGNTKRAYSARYTHDDRDAWQGVPFRNHPRTVGRGKSGRCIRRRARYRT